MKRIDSKKDYISYLEADRSRLTSDVNFKDVILRTEKYYTWKYIKCLRKTEYILNVKKGIFGKFLYAIQLFRLHRLMNKTQIRIYPNVFGPGLFIPHLGRILVSPIAQIGSNCTIRPGVLIGASLGVSNKKLIVNEIGDNVEIAEGCKLLCRKIGDNVVIGPNTVVLRSVPSDSTVFGNPCEIMPRNI